MAKVLLVEDDNNLREIYQARLQAEGYDIVAARDGEEALVVAKQELPDLVISDVMMPKISGFEMLDILRDTEGLRKVKVIMLTALGQADDQHRADTLGADRYLVKSQVTLEDIVNAAQELLTGESATAAAAPEAAPEAAATPTASPEVASPTPTPVAAAPTAVDTSSDTPQVQPEPTTAAEPSLTPANPNPAAEDDTPVIPLATAPPEPTENEDEGMPQMPPTQATTVPVTEEPAAATPTAPEPAEPTEPVTEPVTPQSNPTEVEQPVAPAPSVTPISVTDAKESQDGNEPHVEAEQPAAAPQNTPTTTDTPLATEPAQEPGNDQPLSSSQEQADIEQQIASFVESQPGTPPPVAEVAPEPIETPAEPSAPTAPAVPVAPETTIQPDTVAAPAPQNSENTTTPEQDQLLTDAVNNLSGNEAPEVAPAAPAAEITPQSPEAATPPAAAPAPAEEPTPQKVVIQPITDTSDKPKKSLDELAAEEEAKEKALQELENKQQTPPPAGPANANGDFDPHSISL